MNKEKLSFVTGGGMDRSEVARQKAEELHVALANTGVCPTQPVAFARAEAKRRNIEVEKLPQGDVRLHGGRALYDPGAFLILHEDAGDDFVHAFLIAHEIGHVECGGGHEYSVTANADPLRTAEAAPVGVDRVVDYSRRQRQEVQMDLFARELLLPRSLMRRLHVEEGLTASAIAARYKAPHAVVAQQLFDALLLPPIALSQADSPPPKKLHPDQLAAIAHRGKPFLLEAGPGTGKTQTLVGRVSHLLNSGVEPSRILVLTFSNKAAGELSERIAFHHREAAAAMWIGTFHAFGLDLVRRFHDRLGFTAEPRLLDRTEAIDLLESEYPRLDLAHFKNLWDPSQPLTLILNAISRANDEVVNAETYGRLAEAMKNPSATPEVITAAERSLEVALVFAAYERLKLEKGCVDFGDLVSMPVHLCESFSDIREHLCSLYEHILVDEFQDVNRASVRLLKAMTENGEHLWAVGDAKQSIYRFRGASSFNMKRFDLDDFPGGERGRLTVNYRSVAEVRDSFVSFAVNMSVVAGGEVALDADRGESGHVPERREVGTDEEEVVAVAEAIEEMQNAGHRYRDQAILCSGNDKLARFARQLERLGIPVLYLGSLFERSEIKDLLCLLSLIVDRRAMGLLRLAAMPEHSVSLADIDRVLSHLRIHDCEPRQWVKDLAGIEGITTDGAEGLKRISGLLQEFEITADPWMVLAKVLLDRSQIAAEIASATDIQSRSRGIAIWQFMNFLRTQPPGSGLPIVRVLERIRRLVLHSDERDLRQLPSAAQSIDAVRLMTMHGSKGLEFEVVHIPGLTSASMPRSPNASLARAILPPDGMIDGASGSGLDATRAAMTEEQECLFFVAISRARDRLFLYNPTVSSNARARSRSPFLDRLGSNVCTRRVSPVSALPQDDGDIPIPITLDGNCSFTNHQLALHERCPRRFLYTHILEIGGRRTESAFMRLHVAVQHVVNDVCQSAGTFPSTEEIEESLAAAWQSHGPVDHGFSDDYRRIAQQLVRYLMDSASDMNRLPVPELRLAIPGGEIVVTPDQVLADAKGKVHFRQVRTGHKHSGEGDSLSTAAFHLAASEHSPGCTVQLVHLGDEKVMPIEMTERVLQNRKGAIADMLASVKQGYFPLEESVTCPRCPAFFVCGNLPSGPLVKKMSE
ncbi:MAG: UvrD-helicase domain-containing protein [Pirellulaceae bacterium]